MIARDLAAAVETWLLSDEPLERCMGLGSRAEARRRRRDALLREAASTLEGSRWNRAQRLSEAARAFEVRRWPRWRDSGPPPHASDLDRLLYEAKRYGEVALTARQYFNLL